MQSLDIKRLAEQLSRVVASAILIDCPAVAATAITILSGYFVPAVSAVLNLYRCWVYFTAGSTTPPNCSNRLFYCYCYCYYCSSDCPILTTVPTVLFRCSDYSTAAVSTDCYRPTATDRSASTKCSAIKSFAARCPTAY